ncbi:MAG: putative Ig domain-containing protein [Verrucomicrobiaceae bacterium]|nr:putative Ig domain-containing protein [Verrucomicrobiaceae bacterium]
MPIPTLGSETSIPFVYRGRPFEYILALSPTSAAAAGSGEVWQATGLPTGLTINQTTGRISGTPTVNGASNMRIRVRGSGASDWSAWKTIPIGVVDPPTESITSNATRMTYDIQTDIVYNPITPSDPVLRLTAGDIVMLACTLHEDGIPKKLPYMGRISLYLAMEPQEPGVRVAFGQPALRGAEGSWHYVFEADLSATSVQELVESGLEATEEPVKGAGTGEALATGVTQVWGVLRMEYYSTVVLDPDPNAKTKTSLPFVVLLSRNPASAA